MSKINPDYYTKHTRTITINGEQHEVAPIDLIDRMPYPLGAMLKYLIRYKDKNGKEDLEKAMWYLMHCIKQDVFFNASTPYRKTLFKLFRKECPILVPLLNEEFIDQDILKKFKPILAKLIKEYKEPEKKEEATSNIKKNLDEIREELTKAPIVEVLCNFNSKLSDFFNCLRIFLAQTGAKATAAANDDEDLKEVLSEFTDLTKEAFKQTEEDAEKFARLSAEVASKFMQTNDIPAKPLEKLCNSVNTKLHKYFEIIQTIEESNILDTLAKLVTLDEEDIKKKGLPPEISLKTLRDEFDKVMPGTLLPALLKELNEKVFNGDLEYTTSTDED